MYDGALFQLECKQAERGGWVYRRTPPSLGGYDYDAYPSNFPRPVGNLLPVHAADPRKRVREM